MKTPQVSIITPMYKGAALVGDTIKSVQAQIFTDWEMIIVDDCSPDDGAGCRAVEEFAKNDARIKLIVASVNKGSSGARNEAMRNASGKYLAFLDSDDIWHPEYLSTMMELIRKTEEYDTAIYFCGYRRMDDECKAEVLSPYTAPGKKDFKRLLRHCPIFPSAAIVDTAKLKVPVFFREELRALRDDYVYWLDIMQQGFCAVGFPNILVDYRMRVDSVTASKIKMIKPQWKIYHDILKLGFFKSAFYLVSWGTNGLRKYKTSRPSLSQTLFVCE